MQYPNESDDSWNNDGPDEKTSSMAILLEWLKTGDNYARWEEANTPRRRIQNREKAGKKILKLFKEQGIDAGQPSEDSHRLLQELQKSFWNAVDWLDTKGETILDLRIREEAVLQRCPYYFRLYQALGCIQSTRHMSDETDGEEEDESALVNDDPVDAKRKMLTSRGEKKRKRLGPAPLSNDEPAEGGKDSAHKTNETNDKEMVTELTGREAEAKKQEDKLKRWWVEQSELELERLEAQLGAAKGRKDLLQKNINVLRTRLYLSQEGCNQGDIDEAFPFPYNLLD